MIPPSIQEKMGRNLHVSEHHPLSLIREAIFRQFGTHGLNHPGPMTFCDLDPVVSVKNNFDDLLIPKDHPSRSPSDTYYVDQDRVLRTHTSAHQSELLKEYTNFLVCGDVYRRDEIDKTHYPVFHQLEGVRVYPEWSAFSRDMSLETEIKGELGAMARGLFPGRKSRFVDSYFPFTEPSWELEVEIDGEWLEVAGLGIIRPEILKAAGHEDSKGWAFGLGLERLAMLRFEVPDIRLFWTDDSRFLKQFQENGIHTKFKPYSRFPICYKDISFWVPEGYNPNDFYELVRNVNGDLVESVKLKDEFQKNGKKSHCYRINYQAMDRAFTNEEIDDRQSKIRDLVEQQLKVTIR